MLRLTTFFRNKRIRNRIRSLRSDPDIIIGPTYPTVTNSRLWLDRNANVYSDTAGTTPASINGTIGSWRAVGGAWSNDLWTQTSASQRPIYRSDGMQFDGINDWMSLPTLELSGPFTVYVVYYDTGSGRLVTLFNELFTGIDTLGSDVRVITSAGTFGKTISTAPADPQLRLLRIRRDAANDFYVGMSEVAEDMPGGNSSITLSSINRFGRSIAYMANDKYVRQIVVVNADTVTTGDDAAIVNKLQALEPGLLGIPDNIPPSAPSNLQFVDLDGGAEWYFSWDASEEYGSGTDWTYVIFRNGVEYVDVGEVLEATVPRDPFLPGDEVYVVFRSTAGDSPPSNTVTLANYVASEKLTDTFDGTVDLSFGGTTCNTGQERFVNEGSLAIVSGKLEPTALVTPSEMSWSGMIDRSNWSIRLKGQLLNDAMLSVFVGLNLSSSSGASGLEIRMTTSSSDSCTLWQLTDGVASYVLELGTFIGGNYDLKIDKVGDTLYIAELLEDTAGAVVAWSDYILWDERYFSVKLVENEPVDLDEIRVTW